MSKTANLLYKPMGIVGGAVSGFVATRVVKKVWSAVSGDDDGPPTRRKRGVRWQKVVAGAALQGAVFAAVSTAVDRVGARQFERWSGEYPEG